jgi:hypothetical protein
MSRIQINIEHQLRADNLSISDESNTPIEQGEIIMPEDIPVFFDAVVETLSHLTAY